MCCRLRRGIFCFDFGWNSVRPELVEGLGCCVASATGCLDVGSRTDSRVTFLCVAKEKSPKERPPGFRLYPALLTFDEGFQKGLPSPSENERHPCRSPNGLISPKAPMLGAE